MFKKNIFLILLLMIYSLFSYNQKVIAGIKKSNEIMKWKKINEKSFIDTKDFILKNSTLELNLKNKGYREIKLVIDCRNLTYKKLSKNQKSPEKPIQLKTDEYKIASELCFLTGIEGFYKEIRPASWANAIIKRFNKNPSNFIQKKLTTESASPIVIKNEEKIKLEKNFSSIEDD